MMAIMLDPHFKALHIMENLVGCMNAIWLTFEYDVKVVVPLLMVCFDWLNLITCTFAFATIYVARPKLEENLFGVGVSIEESFSALVTWELSLFRRLFIPSFACADPLAWWQMYECQFPNVGFLAKQNFGILSSQIEIEQVFSLVGVLTALRHCYLQVENMDQIIIMVKN